MYLLVTMFKLMMLKAMGVDVTLLIDFMDFTSSFKLQQFTKELTKFGLEILIEQAGVLSNSTIRNMWQWEL